MTVKFQVSARHAKLPNLNGLYGGKACKREDDLTLTKYEEYNRDKEHYGADETVVKLNECDLGICKLPDKGKDDPGVPQDCNGMWLRWGNWGNCDRECGEFGRRTRTR